jgi:hypothetical protein
MSDLHLITTAYLMVFFFTGIRGGLASAAA